MDLYRYNKLKGITGLIKGLMIPGFRYIFLYRLASQHKNKRNIQRLFYKIILRRYVIKYGIQIPTQTEIGSGFYIGHFGNIVVGPMVRFGNYCNISQGVTIGGTNRGEKKGSPTLGDYVRIGSGAVVVGKITIGNNVLIAPLSYVNFDVRENSLVIGNPAKIIRKENPTLGYVNNVMDKITPYTYNQIVYK